MNEAAPLLKAIGRILRDRFAVIERRVDAARVTGVERVAVDKALIVFGDGSTLPVDLPRGEPGQRGERGADGARGAPGERGGFGEPGGRGEPGPAGERGERGADGVGIEAVEQDEGDAAFAIRLSSGDSVNIELPTGPKGEPGERGEPGRDRFIASPRSVADGERIEKNDLIAWGGGILQAIRSTTRTPDADPASFVCIVAGIESLAMVENIETRTFELTARLTNGIEQTTRIKAMPRFLGDGPRLGERIIRGDQFVKGDWLYTATQDGADAANTEAGGWKRQFLRGKRGEDGARGKDGVGIDSIALHPGGILAVKLTTGEEKYFDVARLAEVAA